MSTVKTTPSKSMPHAKTKAAKSNTAAKPPSKVTVPKAAGAVGTVSAGANETSQSAALRKKELIDNVVARSGVKKKDAKPVVEAILAELGENLAAGRQLILPPLGRVRINREKALANGRVMVVKIRQNDPSLKVNTIPKSDAD